MHQQGTTNGHGVDGVCQKGGLELDLEMLGSCNLISRSVHALKGSGHSHGEAGCT